MENNKENLEISPELAASLFEPEVKTVETENQEDHSEESPVNSFIDEEDAFVPAPTENKTEEEEMPTVTPDTILSGLTTLNSDGHSDAVIIATLERLHNVSDLTTIEDLSEEDREYVDEMVIEDAGVDLYSLDGQLFNLILKFDTVKDAYLKELNEICNRYRAMLEKSTDDNDIVPMLSLTLMPESLKGYGMLNLTFPVGFFRILDDNGVNASMLIQFMAENVQFQALDIDEETKSNLTADVMRELEESGDGSLYE